MSATRHLLNVLTMDSSVFCKEALKTSLMKSQGAMNFLFIRIAKSANMEYLEMQVKENYKSFRNRISHCEQALVASTHFLVYLAKREKFKRFLREVFIVDSVFVSIEKYYKWKQSFDAGLATASLVYFNYSELNGFCGKSLTDPIIHRFEILNKYCHLSEIPLTHTSYVDWESEVESKFDPLENHDSKFLRSRLNSSAESESEGEDSKMSQSVSVPNVQKLEVELSESKIMYPRIITNFIIISRNLLKYYL